MKCYFIDVSNQRVTERDYSGLPDLNVMVQGGIELGHHWPNGDVLYVNSHGLSNDWPNCFCLISDLENDPRMITEALHGHGVVVGVEYEIGPNDYGTRDPATELAWLKSHTVFKSENEWVWTGK